MTERDKERIAKIELIKAKGIARKLKLIQERVDELEVKLQGGAINYDRVIVQTTPENKNEIIHAEIDELIRQACIIANGRNIYKDKINNIKYARHANVLLLYFVYDKSYGEVGEIFGFSKARAVALTHEALLDYFYTNCCDCIDCYP